MRLPAGGGRHRPGASGALNGVRGGLEPPLLDRLPAAGAHAVGPGVDARQRAVHARQLGRLGRADQRDALLLLLALGPVGELDLPLGADLGDPGVPVLDEGRELLTARLQALPGGLELLLAHPLLLSGRAPGIPGSVRLPGAARKASPGACPAAA
jgi:hypothetical protein